MFVAMVNIHVKPEFVDAFVEATLDNCRHSVQEPGVAEFDLVRVQAEPTRFFLYEMYRTPEAQLAHRQTNHYLRWRDTVARMMVEPRIATHVDVLFHHGE
jgi:quinol monooxygenase YgiN